ncbi:hypothetical protein [Streptomyces olivaceoviridis]|uniref:hypothetical protein n=1 Tax=Streptomyces olivaceoviridis TaxID=1921 RepID=UPI0036F8A832
MRFLERERTTTAKLLLGLDDGLRAASLTELEAPDGPGLQLFRDSGDPGLLVPVAQQGREAGALGSRAPSLAVDPATHHFAIAVLVTLADRGALDPMLLAELAGGNRLVASGFPEERTEPGPSRPRRAPWWGPTGYRSAGARAPALLPGR